jgi:hypothetical protein
MRARGYTEFLGRLNRELPGEWFLLARCGTSRNSQ